MAEYEKNNGSTAALIESGRGGKKRSGSKHQFRDKILKSICENEGYTANEIAFEVNGWKLEGYKNCSKRAHDLVLLNYIEKLDNRKCRVSGKGCHVFKITTKGIDYLRRQGLGVDNKKTKPPTPVVLSAVSAKDRFLGIKGILN